jgi:hypothetical protein
LEDVATGFVTRGGVFGCVCDFVSGTTLMPAPLRLPEKSGIGSCFFFICSPRLCRMKLTQSSTGVEKSRGRKKARRRKEPAARLKRTVLG